MMLTHLASVCENIAQVGIKLVVTQNPKKQDTLTFAIATVGCVAQMKRFPKNQYNVHFSDLQKTAKSTTKILPQQCLGTF
jgi:hypothetical protein